MVDGSRGHESWNNPATELAPDVTPGGPAEFTETTSKSWFQRLREALSGILTGVFVLIAAIVLVFWNEGRAVKTATALNEGAGQVVEVSAQTVDPALTGKLVHVSGPIRVSVPPRDAELDVSAPVLRLERKVEMYQWRENKTSKTEKTLGGGEETVTTYSYERIWSDTEHKSSAFRQQQGHANPAFPLRSASFNAAAKLGAYEVKPERLGGLGSAAPHPLEGRQVAMVGSRLGRVASIVDGKAFVGQDPAQPQVGDLRISYSAARVDQASAVATQKGAELVPFTASNGRSIFLLRDGTVTAQDMFENAQKGNTMVTWLLRLVGLAMAIAGFGLILRIASVLADVVPFFGNIVGAGTSVVAMLLGVCLTTLVAGIAWVYYRPLIGLGLLALAAVAIALVWQRGRAGGQAVQRAPA